MRLSLQQILDGEIVAGMQRDAGYIDCTAVRTFLSVSPFIEKASKSDDEPTRLS